MLESFSLDLRESFFLTKKKSSKASRALEERARAPEERGEGTRVEKWEECHCRIGQA